MTGLTEGSKCHLRVLAKNKARVGKRSDSAEYILAISFVKHFSSSSDKLFEDVSKVIHIISKISMTKHTHTSQR